MSDFEVHPIGTGAELMKWRGHNARVDGNQKEIMDALKKIAGISVVSIGKPLDLLVGYYGRTFLIEIKNPDGKDRRGPSWESQQKFMTSWFGQSAVCDSVGQILAVIGYVPPASAADLDMLDKHGRV